MINQEQLQKIMDLAIQKKITELGSGGKSQIKTNYFKTLGFSNFPTYTLKSPLSQYLPKSLNQKFFEKLSLILLMSIGFNLKSEAISSLPRNPDLTSRSISPSASNTEASTCMGCRVRSPQSSLAQHLAQMPIVKEGFARVHNVAIFDEDNRRAVSDLRRKNPTDLTEEERAILRASAQTGRLACKGGGTNATLIQLPDGRDAVITSAHSFLDERTGQPMCDLSSMKYLPNVNFHIDDGRAYSDFVLRTVSTEGDPLNLKNVAGVSKLTRQNDFLIFILSEKISNDQLPNGARRGSMSLQPQSSNAVRGSNYLIGFNKDFKAGNFSSFERCSYETALKTIYHLCDTSYSSSSSSITQLVDGKMVLSGIHIAERPYSGGPGSRKTPNEISERNVGLRIDNVIRFLNTEDLSI